MEPETQADTQSNFLSHVLHFSFEISLSISLIRHTRRDSALFSLATRLDYDHTQRPRYGILYGILYDHGMVWYTTTASIARCDHPTSQILHPTSSVLYPTSYFTSYISQSYNLTILHWMHTAQMGPPLRTRGKRAGYVDLRHVLFGDHTVGKSGALFVGSLMSFSSPSSRRSRNARYDTTPPA